MKYLFLNTASKNNEVLLINDGQVFYDKCGEKIQATENLLPCIDRLFDKAGITLDQTDAFSCVSGPGSFTGIRVGITTVRAFAYACNKKCLEMDYFDILIQNADCNVESAVLIVDSGNGMKYISVRDGNNNVLLAPQYVDIDTVKKFLSEIEEPFCIISDAVLEGYDVILRPEDGSDFLKAAELKAAQAKLIDYKDIIPLYIAKSQAERDKGL